MEDTKPAVSAGEAKVPAPKIDGDGNPVVTRRFVLTVSMTVERSEGPEPDTLKALIENGGYQIDNCREWPYGYPWPRTPPVQG